MSTPPHSPQTLTRLATMAVVAGGVRSGKSRFAVELAEVKGRRRGFIATAQALDDEMRERIASHQKERADKFETVESPRALADVARRIGPFDVVLLDCLTLYVSNVLLDVGDVEHLDRGGARRVEEDILNDLKAGIHELRKRAKHLVVVTNEVGMGVVPVSRLGRLFRDVAGRVNQWVASEASEVWWCALGIPLRIKPTLLVGRGQ